MNNASHLRFVNVAEPGYLGDERVVLRPSIRLNLMDYILLPMKGTPTPGDAEDLNLDVFWFPFKEVEADDFVLLYSKAGEDHSFTDPKGNEVHVLYWNREKAVWRDHASVVAIVKISDWAFHGIEKPALEKAG